MGSPQPHGVLRRLREGSRLRPTRQLGAAPRVRARQGGLRSGLRGTQPADLAGHPARLGRAARDRGDVMTEPKKRVRKAPAKAPVDPVVAAEATAPVVADEAAVAAPKKSAPRQKAAAEATAPVTASGTVDPPDSSYPSSGPLEAGGPTNEELERLAGGGPHNPHSILGIPPVDKGVVLRALRPGAERVVALIDGKRVDLHHCHAGIWEEKVEGTGVTDYRLEVTYSGNTYPADDPFRSLPTLGEMDLHLIGEGRHEELWTVLGSHVRRYETPNGP